MLLFNTEGWLNQNYGPGAASDAKMVLVCKVLGICCLSLRFFVHHSRVIGKRKMLNGISINLAGAATWLSIAYLNHTNEGLYVDGQGFQNKVICGVVGAALLADHFKIVKLKAT
eukprot:g2200.t1